MRSDSTQNRRWIPRPSLAVSAAFAALLAGASPAAAVPLTVTVENLAPAAGFFLTPTWVAFHDGSFDLFNQGSPIPQGFGFERLVEDGVTAGTGPTVTSEFRASPAGTTGGGIDRTITGPAGFNTPPVLDPGERNSLTLDVSPTGGRFFTFASMVIPSNDAFISNDDPRQYEIFDAAGNFKGPLTLLIAGNQVRDAGTELNNEMDAAFFNQLVNGNGTATNDPVSFHPGLFGSVGNPAGTRVILGGTSVFPGTIFFDATNADFTRSGINLMRITIVPEPTFALLPLLAALAAGRPRRRSWK